MSQSLITKRFLPACVSAFLVLGLLGCSGDARVLEEGIEAHNLQVNSIAIKAPGTIIDPSTGVEQKLFENTNQTIAFSIEATNTAGSLVSVSSDNRLWTVSNPAVATINQNGVLQTLTEGSVSIDVSLGGIIAPAFELTVSDAPLVGLNSISGDKALERCIPATYSVIGNYSDSTRLLKAASWSIENDSLGSYTNLPEGQVSVNGVNVGALVLVATVGDSEATKTIDINNTLNEIIIQNPDVVIEAEDTVEMVAVGRYFIGDEEQLIDISSHVHWQNPEQQTAASVESTTGLLTGLEPGNTSVTASCGNLLSLPKSVVVLEAGSAGDSSQLTFNELDLNESDLLELRLTDGAFTSLKVSTGSSYSVSNDITASATWTVEVGNSVSISLIDGALSITPLRVGKSTIKATYDGASSNIIVEVVE